MVCDKHLFCLEELKSWKTQYPDLFDYTICLSKPEEKTEHVVGRVTDAMKELPPDATHGATAFLCGSRPMVQEAKAFLEEQGIGKGEIHQKAW